MARRAAAPSRPAITRVITRLNIGGPARQEIELTATLRRQGFDCELIAGMPDPQEGTAPGAEAADRVIMSLQRDLRPGRDLRALGALTAHLRSRRPDVLHTHLAKAGALGRLAGIAAGVPVMLHTYHGHVLRGYFSSRATDAFVQMERSLARHTDALVAVSPVVRDELLALGVGRPDQWHVIPLGLDLDSLQGQRDVMRDCRDRLCLPPTGPVVAMVGRLVAVKDPQLFLEAAQLVASELPEVTFVVAGDGALRGQMQRRASAMFGDGMRFLGWARDVATVYGAADVVVLSSRHEGTPATLIEASAAGRPVVATDVGGVSDVVVDGVTGLLVPSGDPGRLALATLAVLRDAELAQAMGTAGRLHSARFSTRRLASDLAALYVDLLVAKPRRRASRALLGPRTMPVPWH